MRLTQEQLERLTSIALYDDTQGFLAQCILKLNAEAEL